MSIKQALAQLPLTKKGRGMAPFDAVGALSMSETGAVSPYTLSAALVAAYEHGITAAQMAVILHRRYPDHTALEIGRAVLAGLPGTTKNEMFDALMRADCRETEVDEAVRTLHPAGGTVTVTATDR